MSLIVKKFGGTSVGSPERIKGVALRVIEAKKDHDQIVVVVSAMGGTTDSLIKLAKEMSDQPHPREYDALVSTGENVSAALLAMCLQDRGTPAVSLNGHQAGIRTETNHSKAKILTISTERIEKELEAGNVVIVTGFQGMNANNDTTTFGRGGSDTSAVALAAALDCPVCEIYTDVNGIYTTDPRIVANATKLNEISYDEMLELASLGAKVLHPRSVECAKENNIQLHVRSSFSPEIGTMVKEQKTMEAFKPVTGIALNKKEAIISILEVPDSPGAAGKIFSKIAAASINIDMIIQSSHNDISNDISFTVNEDDLAEALKVTEAVAEEIGASSVTSNASVAKISIVGVGMISKPGIAARMFESLGSIGLNIIMISTSEIKISCAIDRAQGDRALTLLHDEFKLEQVL
ncbi:MAG: aspartate kinase [Candidatus Marinamargulisbacteria bacterium]|jgi:aspartate kinase